MDSLRYEKFSEFDHDDSFFDSLKADYTEFPVWLKKKADNGESAYVLYDDAHQIEGFMYLKEDDDAEDITPSLPNGKHLKIGTFKFESKGTLRGQRFLKKAFDHAISSCSDDIYVTVFEKHEHLIRLFQTYGFYKHGEKESVNGKEYVYARSMHEVNGDVLLDYPLVLSSQGRKFLLAIYPEFHTRLFPDSKLVTESPDMLEDVSHANSIHKIYICGMRSVAGMKRGDIIVIYRTGDNQGPAYYRAVASSICVVENVRHMDDFPDEEAFIKYCSKFSVFSEEELREYYSKRQYPYVLRFTYNLALPKRPNRATLINQVGLNGTRGVRWSHFELSDMQFNKILEVGKVDESFIVNQA
ncbi:N-acetyltransferase [Klebsiella pneumoniae]|uniref:N-acetyltransferase n=1 Tax=Klebsiella pneumoniae TaxID=573 RepID=UPI00257A3E87|nr:N-acetyltransferase [Klebsiella pneumoniae]MDM3511723.1 N-acetyltransferase [Klebsiella pneumoniae]HBX5449708.1 N-acetyltransferase [Klebsiella pneumoniae]HBX5466410.1 N-acetyltransferase [Klebsiella pneumoniae]HBX5476509.1 N-acetyltransferase [Klebsiella pneumoniae]HDY9252116.1 N-acetyltransferase [Klebsiella pneumoniae]